MTRLFALLLVSLVSLPAYAQLPVPYMGKSEGLGSFDTDARCIDRKFHGNVCE